MLLRKTTATTTTAMKPFNTECKLSFNPDTEDHMPRNKYKRGFSKKNRNKDLDNYVVRSRRWLNRKAERFGERDRSKQLLEIYIQPKSITFKKFENSSVYKGREGGRKMMMIMIIYCAKVMI